MPKNKDNPTNIFNQTKDAYIYLYDDPGQKIYSSFENKTLITLLYDHQSLQDITHSSSEGEKRRETLHAGYIHTSIVI